ncbi:MAG: glycosyltransferase family 2 protein [Candidatus Dormibacteraceae bacterium]
MSDSYATDLFGRQASDLTISASVVVPTWRRSSWLERCLAALASQIRPPNEVLVVGRAEDSAARAVATHYEAALPCPLLWLEVATAGHIPPILKGIERTSAEIVSFLDDDTEPESGWLAALLEAFAEPAVACVGGRVVTPGLDVAPAPDAGRLRWYGRYVGNVGELVRAQPVEVDGVVECNWAWRVEVLRRLEFAPVLALDDSLHYGLDLCLQAKRLGYRVLYTSEATVTHHMVKRDGTVPREDTCSRSYIHGRNFTYIGLKRYSWARRLAFLFWWFGVGERQSYGVLKAAWDLPRARGAATRQLRSALAGRWAGVRAWGGKLEKLNA